MTRDGGAPGVQCPREGSLRRPGLGRGAGTDKVRPSSRALLGLPSPIGGGLAGLGARRPKGGGLHVGVSLGLGRGRGGSGPRVGLPKRPEFVGKPPGDRGGLPGGSRSTGSPHSSPTPHHRGSIAQTQDRGPEKRVACSRSHSPAGCEA